MFRDSSSRFNYLKGKNLLDGTFFLNQSGCWIERAYSRCTEVFKTTRDNNKKSAELASAFQRLATIQSECGWESFFFAPQYCKQGGAATP